MVETDTISDIVEMFDNEDSISAFEPTSDHDVLVKVNDESAVGRFFEICRKHDLSRESTTRDAISTTVLDSWINL